MESNENHSPTLPEIIINNTTHPASDHNDPNAIRPRKRRISATFVIEKQSSSTSLKTSSVHSSPLSRRTRTSPANSTGSPTFSNRSRQSFLINLPIGEAGEQDNLMTVDLDQDGTAREYDCEVVVPERRHRVHSYPPIVLLKETEAKAE